MDEEGNAVRYDNDDEYDEDDVQKVPGNAPIIKLIGNMNQGKKIMQSTKVAKSVLQKKEGKIKDLMNQIGEDDDSSEGNDDNKIINNKGKANIDYALLDDYQPAYDSKNKIKENIDDVISNEPLEENIDIESDNKPIKQRTIKREKKVIEDPNNTIGSKQRNRS